MNKGILTSPFPIYVPAFYFTNFVVLGEDVEQYMTSTGESGLLCLVPDFSGNALRGFSKQN